MKWIGTIEELQDDIDMWHETNPGMQLLEWLDMTWDEWVHVNKHPEEYGST